MVGHVHRVSSPRLALLAALFVAAHAGRVAAAQDTGALDKTIAVDLWGRHLGDAVSQVTERSKVDVVVDPHFVRPREFRKHRLYLEASRLPVRTVIEWLCRALGCRYRTTGPHSVLLTDTYSWMEEKRTFCIPSYSLDSLMAPGQTVKDFERKLWEIVKPNALFGPAFYLRIEVDFINDREQTRRLVAVLPHTLKQYLEEALQAMAAPGQPIQASRSAKAHPEQAELINRLRKPIVLDAKKKWSVRQVLREIRLQAGIQVAFDHEPFRSEPPPRIGLALGEVTAREAIEATAESLGFNGYESMPPGSVWLTTAARRWTTAASREFLWEGLVLKSYAVGDLVQAVGGGEVLCHRIRRGVCVDTWKDPATAVVYHVRSGNLLVLAPPDVQDAVVRELVRLQTAWRHIPLRGSSAAAPAAQGVFHDREGGHLRRFVARRRQRAGQLLDAQGSHD